MGVAVAVEVVGGRGLGLVLVGVGCCVVEQQFQVDGNSSTLVLVAGVQMASIPPLSLSLTDWLSSVSC